MVEEKEVLKALVCRANDPVMNCAGCPYRDPECEFICDFQRICRDTLTLLKAREARVMTWAEIVHSIEIEAPAIWLEDRDKIHVIPALTIISCVTNSENATFVIRGIRIDAKHSDYGKRWRAWTARPTDEQRKAVPWND